MKGEIAKEDRSSNTLEQWKGCKGRVRRLFVHLSWDNPFVHIA